MNRLTLRRIQCVLAVLSVLFAGIAGNVTAALISICWLMSSWELLAVELDQGGLQ